MIFLFSMSINLLRESPSVLFCASDGKHLRVYQVVCNAKALLASQYTTSKVIVRISSRWIDVS